MKYFNPFFLNFRFCRDGNGSVLEPKGQKFYADGMTQKFEGLESEWPIFHAFMVIDGVFKNIDSQVEHHQNQLKRLIKYTDKGGKFENLNIFCFGTMMISEISNCVLVKVVFSGQT